MKIYRGKIKDSDYQFKVSVTASPRIELKTLMFSKDNEELPNMEVIKMSEYEYLNDEKRILAGPAMVPNKLIEYKDFLIFFTEEDVRDFKAVFEKDGQLINYDHKDDILKSAEIIYSSLEGTGDFDYPYELPEGTWFLATKYNEEDWNVIKEGRRNGYSVEGTFDRVNLFFSVDVEEENKENKKNDNIEMSMDEKYLELEKKYMALKEKYGYNEEEEEEKKVETTEDEAKDDVEEVKDEVEAAETEEEKEEKEEEKEEVKKYATDEELNALITMVNELMGRVVDLENKLKEDGDYDMSFSYETPKKDKYGEFLRNFYNIK